MFKSIEYNISSEKEYITAKVELHDIIREDSLDEMISVHVKIPYKNEKIDAIEQEIMKAAINVMEIVIDKIEL